MKHNDKQVKEFRKWCLNEEEKPSEKPQRNYAAEKEAERKPKYQAGWINVSVMVPPSVAEKLKSYLEDIKRDSPHLFDLGKETDKSETES